MNHQRKNLDFEEIFWKEGLLISGSDESGRGSLAGPIVVASVILPIFFKNNSIQDSKTLSPLQREKAFEIIKKAAICFRIEIISVLEIEEKNPLASTKEGFKKTLLKLRTKPDISLIDGKENIFLDKFNTKSLVGGDRKSINIAAASILAKVIRDKIMMKLHKKFPFYNWYFNKGYARLDHLKAIFDFGFCYYHRRNYDPVKSLLKDNSEKQKDNLRRKYKI